jgi:uncharacterized membrane protein YhhN
MAGIAATMIITGVMPITVGIVTIAIMVGTAGHTSLTVITEEGAVGYIAALSPVAVPTGGTATTSAPATTESEGALSSLKQKPS